MWNYQKCVLHGRLSGVAVENTSWKCCPPLKQSNVDHRFSRNFSKLAAPRPIEKVQKCAFLMKSNGFSGKLLGFGALFFHLPEKNKTLTFVKGVKVNVLYAYLYQMEVPGVDFWRFLAYLQLAECSFIFFAASLIVLLWPTRLCVWWWYIGASFISGWIRNV